MVHGSKECGKLIQFGIECEGGILWINNLALFEEYIPHTYVLGYDGYADDDLGQCDICDCNCAICSSMSKANTTGNKDQHFRINLE